MTCIWSVDIWDLVTRSKELDVGWWVDMSMDVNNERFVVRHDGCIDQFRYSVGVFEGWKRSESLLQ